MKKILALSLALMMVLALVLTGCGGNQSATTTAAATTAAATTAAATTAAATTAAPAADPVPVHWWSPSGSVNHPDKDMVYEHLCNMFLEDLNVDMNLHFFASAEYAEKANAAMSAAQPMDIAQTNSSRLVFTTWVARGGFMGITDLLTEYAPETYAAIPDWCWSAVTVDNEIYAIPSYKDVVQCMGFIYNDTMLTELGLANAVEELNWCTAYDLDELAYKVKDLRNAAHPEWEKLPLISWRNNQQMYYQYDQLASIAYTAIDGFFLEDEGLADGTKVFNVYDTVEHANAMKLIKRWVDDGIYPYDAQNYDSDGTIKKSGAMLGSFSHGTVAVERNQYEAYEQVLVKPRQTFANTTYVHGAMNGIAAHATAPAEAMQCLEKIFMDPIYATTWRFGIQGTHWNAIEKDGKLRADFVGTRNEDPTNRGFYSWYHAECGNLFTCYLPIQLDDEFYEKLDAMNSSACVSVNMGFLADVQNIENEIAACSGVVSEYNLQLMLGMLPDVDATLTEFNEKLNANGAEKIVAEMQTQLDAWRAAK